MNKKILITFIISFVVSFFIFFSRFIIVGCGIHGDGIVYYSNLRSLVFDGDFDITNELKYFATSASKFSKLPRASTPENSPTYSLYPIGLSLLWSPFYILGHIISYILVEVFRLNLRLDGFGGVYEFMVCLGSFIYGSLGLILAYRLLNKFFPKNISFIALLGIWFATPFTYYYMIDPSMSHSCAFFMVNLFLYIFFTKNKNHLTAILSGLITALVILIRLQDIALVIIPLVDMVIRRKNFLFFFLLFSIAFCLCIPQILIYKNLFGSLYNIPYLCHMKEGGFSQIFHPYIHKILFSSGRGLFTWTPITLPAIIWLFISIKRFKLISLFLLSFFLVEVYISAVYVYPQIVGLAKELNLGIKEVLKMDIGIPQSSFGMRYLISASFCFLFGLGSLLFYLKKDIGQFYKISLVFIAILIIHNILFIFQYLLETFPINGCINFLEILKNDFFIVFKLISTLRELILR